MNFTFEEPILFLLLFLYPICNRFCKAKFEAIFFPRSDRLKKISKKQSTWLNIVKFLIFFLLITSLASPVIEDEVVIQNDKGYEISLILDASGSMSENHKFDIVKEIVKDFIKHRKHDKIALTIFGDFAYVAIPLTYDKDSILNLLQRVDVGVAGYRATALYDALFLSTKLFKNSKSKNKIAILLTDGMDNASSVPLEVAINTAKKFKIRVYTIGIGQRGDYNPYVLEKIAKETGAKFFEANSAQRLKEIYDEIDKLEKSEIKANKYVKKRYLFMYPLSLALLLMMVLLAKKRSF